MKTKINISAALKERIKPAETLTQKAVTLVNLRSSEWKAGLLPARVVEGAGEDKVAADELFQWATDDGDWYRRWASPVIKNLQTKVKSGKYDKALSLKSWGHAADAAADAYAKEFGDKGAKGRDMFTPSSLKMAAIAFANEYDEEIQK